MNVERKIGALVLAAGASRRMGRPKQLLLYRGRSLLRHAAQTAAASRCRPVAVVVGASAESLTGELSELLLQRALQVVENTGWMEGVGSSIAVGVRALIAAEEDVEALVIMLCDQPLISAQFIDKLAETYERTGKPIVASEYKWTIGVYALFDRALFTELMALGGDCGEKGVIAKHKDDVEPVPFPEGAIDIDTPQEYERLQASTADELSLAHKTEPAAS